MLRQTPWGRLLAGGLFLWLSLSFAGSATSDKFQTGSAFGAAICLLIGGIIIGSSLVKPASRPFTGLIDKIYFGSDSSDEVPLLNLRLARAYRGERCFRKCIEECERQLEFHSLAPELWAELLLAHRAAGNREAEARTLDRALDCLGMTRTPGRFAKIVNDRDNLPDIAAGLVSQFDR